MPSFAKLVAALLCNQDEVERDGAATEAEATAALDLDPDLVEAHLARAAVARKREFDWNATMTASRRALVLNPNLEQARFFMAAAYFHLGYMEEALIEMRKGRMLHGADAIEPVRIEAALADDAQHQPAQHEQHRAHGRGTRQHGGAAARAEGRLARAAAGPAKRQLPELVQLSAPASPVESASVTFAPSIVDAPERA